MKLEIDINEEQMIHDIMESYPDYSAGNCLSCEHWDYKNNKFTFRDLEEDKVYEVDMEKLKKGLKIFFDLLVKGKFKTGMDISCMLDVGNWDGYITDALVQCAIFGDVIYG